MYIYFISRIFTILRYNGYCNSIILFVHVQEFLTFCCICILENIDFFQNWNELWVGFTFLLNIFILVNIFRRRKTLSICLMALWLAKTFVKWPTMFQFDILYSFHLSNYTGMENERSGDYYWFTFWSQINSKVFLWNCNSI